MKKITGCLAILLNVLCFAGCDAREFAINNDTAGGFAFQLKQASEQHDVKAIADAYATHATIDIQVPDASYPFTGPMTREQYSTKLAELAKQAKSYQLNWENPSIEIAADKKSAKTSAVRIERFELPEGTREFRLQETLELAVADRKIVITRQILAPAP